MSRYMPPEWTPHSATWMGFPSGAYAGAGVSDDDVFDAWAAVANLIVDHEPVHMLCNPQQLRQARKRLSEAVVLHAYALNDAWLRDSGPTFVIENDSLLAVDWRFNGWGDNTQFDWATDAAIARHIAALSQSALATSKLTNEGGGIHVDGNGTILLTDTVQLDPDRNRDWSRQQVEDEIHQQLGTERAVWLADGLYRDYLDHGTRGHVDIVACFTEPGRVLLHRQQDKQHPDASRYAKHRDALAQADIEVRDLPAPLITRDNIDWVDYSYINHYVLNGAVVVPTFNDRNDAQALDILADAWPGRDIRPVDGRVIFAMGGGVHCITQQQPAVR